MRPDCAVTAFELLQDAFLLGTEETFDLPYLQ